MRLSTMRRIDYWVGVPACFLLSAAVRALEVVRGRKHAPSGSRRVLFIELSEMGSTILAAPSIARVISHSKTHSPCFVIFKKNAASLKLLRLFDEDDIYTIRDTSLVAMLVDILGFVAFCRRKRIDATLDLELFSRVSAILAMLSGAQQRVGFDNYLAEGLNRGPHLTHRVHYNPYQHMSRNFLALVEGLDRDPNELPAPKRVIPEADLPPQAPHCEEEYAHVRAELFKRVELDDRTRIVVLNPDAGKLLPIRTWPAERFAEVARSLLTEPDVVVVLMGIPEAADAAEVISGIVKDERCVNFVGCTRTLQDVIQLFRMSALLITNDSGPAHFATLTDIKVVTLFGPETARLYGPRGENAINIDKQLACSPCLTAFNHRNSPCTDNQCLKLITADEVLVAARELLGRGAAAEAS